MRTEITISGYVVGPIWCGEECYKEFRYNLTAVNERVLGGPLTLREHVLKITNDGDFAHCEIADGVLEVTTYKPNRRRSRIFDLAMFPSIADCVKLDWDGPSYDYEEPEVPAVCMPVEALQD